MRKAPSRRGRAALALPACLVATLAAGWSAAAAPEDGHLTLGEVPRAAGPLKMDGQLDEAARDAALSIPLPWEVYPADNTPAATATTALLLLDDENLYVGFRAEDRDPGSIRGHYTDHDTAFRDDLVGFVLDPFDDRRSGLLFAANPFGVQMDSRAAQSGEGRGFNVVGAPAEGSSWDELWDSAGRIEAGGFTVEIAIPFRSLRYPRGGRHDAVDDDTQVGQSARWGITPNATLNVAPNPDFSQVEADALRPRVNDRFALFYPEKRRFFLAGATLFATPIVAVYTRTVVEPQAVVGRSCFVKFGYDWRP